MGNNIACIARDDHKLAKRKESPKKEKIIQKFE